MGTEVSTPTETERRCGCRCGCPVRLVPDVSMSLLRPTLCLHCATMTICEPRGRHGEAQVSECCGALEVEERPGICTQCREHTSFERPS